MDHLGIPLAVVLGCLYFGFVWIMARFCSANTRAEERQAEANRFEVDGSWAAYLASMEARKRRVDEVRRNWDAA